MSRFKSTVKNLSIIIEENNNRKNDTSRRVNWVGPRNSGLAQPGTVTC